MNVAEQTNASESDAIRKTAPILIIEDEVDLLRTYERLLRRLGYEVLTADCGAEGLRLADSRELVLVVTDLKLPDIDGLKVVEAIRAQGNGLPIIVVSGFGSTHARGAALAAGADAYLAKPFAVSAFIDLIRKLLGS